ncbi:hypothetical protein [Chelatococcus albus]|nr:hypothetical protein [Chelatococcus sp. SYSU_G07232]
MAQAMDLPEAETPPEAAARAPAVVRVPLRRPAVPADRVVRVPLSLMEYGRPIPARAAHGQDGARADEASRPLQAAPATEDVAAEQGAAGVRSSIGRSPSARLWAAVGAVLIVLAGAALYLVLRSSGAEGGLVRESAVQRKIAY